MLLAFRAENVRSFRDELELSLIATGLAEPDAVRQVSWREGGRPVGVLPVAGIFGANASGKTNVVKAMDDMRTHVLGSFRSADPTRGIQRRPFRLDPEARRQPSRFEVDLVLNGVRHEYGFILDDDRVLEEWALRYPRGRGALLFRRKGDAVEIGADDRAKSRAVIELLRPNALFLSTAASANHPSLLPLFAWFDRNLLLADAASRSFRKVLTTRLIDDQAGREQVLALLRAADLGVIGVRRHKIDPETKERMQRVLRILADEGGDLGIQDDDPVFEDLDVRLTHQGTVGDVDLEPDEESFGTLVWFGLVGPVVDALAKGSVFLADELDASLHPALVAQLVRLFQDPVANPRRAQLIFNSHDVTILGDAVGDRLIGRDQIWFTEKSADGSTRVYALADLDPRKEEAIGRRYLAGRYGGVPILSSQEFAAAAEQVTSGERE
jgi:uncharacterized protein